MQKKTCFWTCKVVEMHAPTTKRLLVHKVTAALCSQQASKPTVWSWGFILNLRQNYIFDWCMDVFCCLHTKNECAHTVIVNILSATVFSFTVHQHLQPFQSISTLAKWSHYKTTNRSNKRNRIKFSVLLNSWPMKKAYKESTNLVKSKQINKHQQRTSIWRCSTRVSP